MRYLILALSALYLCVTQALAQAEWKRVAARDGIKVYARSVPDSKIKAMKAESVLDAGVDEVLALLLDVKAAERWVCHTKSCKLIKKVSDTELFYHTEVSLPWPLDNRDFVTHLKIIKHENSDVVTVEAPAVPGVVPVREGVVRINASVNRWLIRPLPNGKVWVEYTLQVDPGGYIPAHVVNMFACRAPIETFQNMRGALSERKGKPTSDL
ncbi:START domain-containing protein [Dyadobacter sp. SG02]|uniref:START domain-containing protein n=1 Tax=Dyadobacter sp. SG02 TaxID=1855291 RepID=UPI0008C0DA68|nr:START domain-containing protein [Dyadobacter sp. SG02]SEI38967.1 START domain-containing protein [Dyadobacter sp. SG02]